MRLGLGLGLTRLGTGGTFTPQLNNLFLSSSTVAENVSSGTTVGALTNTQVGSTYSLIDNAGGRFALSGTNINTATLTDVAVDTVYNITVRETNGTYPNSPRDSVISITVTAVVGGGLPARSAPTLTLADNTTYPPPLSILLAEDVEENDVLRVQSSASITFGTVIIDDLSTLDAAAIASGNISVAGLSAITSPAQTYFRASVNGGAWSNIIKHGDTVAPTFTSSANPSVAENTVNPTGALTFSEEVETVAIIGGTDAALFSLVGSTWTLNATPDFELKTTYVVQFSATDYGGNSTSQTMTLTITDVAEVTPSAFSTTFKHAFVDLSNSDLTVTSQVVADGGRRGVRSTQARNGKKYFEVTVNAMPSNEAYIGVALLGLTIAGVNFERPTTNAAYVSEFGYVYPGDGTGAFGAVYRPALNFATAGTVVGVAFDTTADKVWFSKNGVWDGDPTAGTGGHVLPTGTTDVFAFVGMQPNTTAAQQMTANFGATSFAYSIPSGFGAMT